MKNEDKDLVKLAGAGGLLAVVGSGSKLNEDAAKYYLQKGKSNSKKFAEESKSISGKLKDLANKQKTAVIRGKGGEGSFHMSEISDTTKESIRKQFKPAKDAIKKLREYRKEVELQTGKKGLRGTPHEGSKRKIKTNLKEFKKVLNSRDLIAIDHSLSDPTADLAHELGHSMHVSGRNGSKVGKIAHKLKHRIDELDRKTMKSLGTNNSFKVGAGIGTGLGVTGGLLSGIKAGRDEKKGKKESVLNKLAPYAAPIAYKTPELVSEFEASRQGLKLLKKVGASKEYRKAARKTMGAAFGTYASALAAPLLAGYGARQAGKVIGRRTVKTDDNNKK